MIDRRRKYLLLAAACLAVSLSACRQEGEKAGSQGQEEKKGEKEQVQVVKELPKGAIGSVPIPQKSQEEEEQGDMPPEAIEAHRVGLSPDLPYFQFTKINEGQASLYKTNRSNRKGLTVCVNAGHGTQGGEAVRIQCHPDGSPKVTGGSNAEGEVTAMAVSSGMTFADGTPEAAVTLQAAGILKDVLLESGYDVLMIRETEDVQLDNIARTILANHYANCHIALHWDATANNKGVFYMKVPSVESYKAMVPVINVWEDSDRLGESLIQGLAAVGKRKYGSGSMEMDLTQTSYSSIPSVDIELGDRASDHSEESLHSIANGLLTGINIFFGFDNR